MDVVEVLADVARLGPFFAVGTGSPERDDPAWRPVAELYAGGGALAERIAHVRSVLGSDDRVAASITFQGIAALLLSAPFAAVVAHGVLPRLTATTLHWRASTTGPWPLWCADPVGLAVPDAEVAAGALADALFDEHLVPLVVAVRGEAAVSEQVLWGNVASSVASGKRLVGAQWPGSAGRAMEVAERLLGIGPLAGTGELLAPSEPDHGWTFRRRSCCLYYRARDGGLCGDCVLHARR